MRIYVASKYEEKAYVSEIMDALRKAGHVITYDWTTNEQVNEAQARADMNGVRSAEALVLIAEKDLNYCGALVELGIALGLRIPIFVVGKALNDRCIFMRLPEIRRDFETLLYPPV